MSDIKRKRGRPRKRVVVNEEQKKVNDDRKKFLERISERNRETLTVYFN